MQHIKATRNLRSQPFTLGDNPIATRNAWDDWLLEIEWEFRCFKITEPLDYKDALIIDGRKELARLEKSLPNLTDGDQDYENLRKS